METVALYYLSITCLSLIKKCWVKGRLICFLLLNQYRRERKIVCVRERERNKGEIVGLCN